MVQQSGDGGSQRLGVAYELVEPLPEARVDLAMILRVRVHNTGPAPWSNRGAYPVNLSYHWFDIHGQPVDFEGLRAIMPGPLRPGESVELELQVEPPPRPGDYQLVLDMVEEGVDWFSMQGISGFHIPVTVAPHPGNMPRVCIVNGNCTMRDAVGTHVINQIRFFLDRGYHTVALLEHVDPRQPAKMRRHIVQTTIEDLREHSDNPQVRRGIRQFQNADLYIFNYSTFYPLIDAIRLVDHGIVIFDYHGVTPPHLWEGPGIETLIEGQRRLSLAQYADYAIGHSSYTCNELIQTGAISPERVFQMGYPVALDHFRPGPKPEMLLERYGLTAEQPVLLYVGRMAVNKRVEDLVRALPMVREQLPDAVLVLVGDNQTPAFALLAARVKQLIEQLGLDDAVIFTGMIPDDELVLHYQLADVFVTASVHEGFCIPVLEAMASGVPVVGAHATALPETIGSGGLTFRPEDPADLAEKVLSILGSAVSVEGLRVRG